MSDDEHEPTGTGPSVDGFDDIVAGYDTAPPVHIRPDQFAFPAAAPRGHVNRGVAGSLLEERRRALATHRANLSPGRLTLTGLGALLPGVAAAVIAQALNLPPAVAVPVSLAVAAAVAIPLGRALLRSPRALALTEQIRAERRAAAELRQHLAGSGWSVLHDRVLPRTEQRVPFILTGPGGVLMTHLVPPGPYSFDRDQELLAAGEPLTNWMAWRLSEYDHLVEQLLDHPSRDLHFKGPAHFVLLDAYATGATEEFHPTSINTISIRTPAGLAREALSLPRIFVSKHQQQALWNLVNQACPAAPET